MVFFMIIERMRDMVENMETLKEDIKKYLETFANAYVNKAAELLTEEAKSAVKYFYDDYDPKYYLRTDNFKKNSYKKYLKNNGRYYYGGVRLSSENMSPYVEDGGFFDPGIVFEAAATLGIHGKISEPAHITSPTVVEHVQEFRDSSFFQRAIFEDALETAKKQTYKTIEFI